ncbi:gremlin [Trichuris trichiura]|uniref:Gremlin n=1 Tax=Trichuris trichiura TaxID=36087 RepID=A0A077ZEX6_TRITR|nr:gremlin [Trichuris trichiura]
MACQYCRLSVAFPMLLLLLILMVHNGFIGTSHCMTVQRQEMTDANESAAAQMMAAPNRPSYFDLSRNAFLSLVSTDEEDQRMRQQWPESRRRKNGQRDRQRQNGPKRKGNRKKQKHFRPGANELGDEPLSSSSSSSQGKSLLPRPKPPPQQQTYVVASRDMIGVEHCRTIPFKQRIRIDGCLSKTVVNNICHGQCNSFFIPRLHSSKLRALFESYSVCRPTQVTTVTVHLRCPNRVTPIVRRKYFKVKQCSCMSASEPLPPSYAA